MSFIHDGFLLNGTIARRLYDEHAAPQPIFDYHNHLPPRDIAADRTFRNLFEIWLEGDHYKWRAMRANGVPERFCTGDAEPVREIQGLGRHRAAVPAQPAVSLDPSRAETLLRHRRSARRDDGRARVGARERAAAVGRPDGARHPREVRREDPLHDGRSRRRSHEPRPDPRLADRHARLPDVPSRPGPGRPPARHVQPLDRASVRDSRHRDRALRRPARRAPEAAPGLPRRRRPRLRPRPVTMPGRRLQRAGRGGDVREGARGAVDHARGARRIFAGS